MILVVNTCHNSIFKKSRLIGTFLFSLLFYSCTDNTNTNGRKSLEKDESSRKNSSENNFYTIEGFAQGTTYQIKYEASHDLKIKREIDSLLQDFDWHLSTYLDSSLISDFNNADVHFYCQIVSSIIANCFLESRKIYEVTDGAFNPAVYPLVDFWGFYDMANKEHQPTREEIDSVLKFIVFDSTAIQLVQNKWIDTDELSVNELCKVDARLKLDFNAIAQGFSVDLIGLFLKSWGVENYMVELGGEVKCRGVNAYGNLWKIGIDRPSDGASVANRVLNAAVLVDNKGLATSGNYRKFYELNGIKYAHTIDPRTGMPVSHSLLSTTVVSDKASVSDAYATAFMVLGVEETKLFLEKHEELDLDVYLIYANANGEFITWMNSGMKAIIEEF